MDRGTFRAAKNRYAEDGVVGLTSAGLVQLRSRLRDVFAYPVGKAIELRGDRVEYRGVRLSLNDPTIETALKSRFVYGTYEADETVLITQFVPPDLPVVELGGCIGFTACYTNARMNPDTVHVVLEANPDLIPTLRRNRRLNDASFEIRPLAYSSDSSSVTFNHHPKFVGGSAQRETTRQSTVEAIDLSTLLRTNGIDTCSLIVDIEGGEFELIDTELSTLQQHVAVFLVEFHDFVHDDIETYNELLTSSGFVKLDARSNVVVYGNEHLNKSKL